jgi:hypothetical protein
MSVAGVDDGQGAEGALAGGGAGGSLHRSTFGDRHPSPGQTGDKVEITERTGQLIIFMIEKTNNPIEDLNAPSFERAPHRDN